MSPAESTCYLAFDLGASTSRAVLGTLADGVLKMEELHRFRTPIREMEGHLFWDLDLMWSEMQIGLDMALSAAPRLKSLSVDSWAVDYVRLDASGAALANPYCYRDIRTANVMESAFAKVTAERIYEITGIQFLPFNTLYQVLADRHVGHDVPGGPTEGQDADVSAYLPIADYFNYRFSGRRAVEVSMASTTQMMDVHARTWSTEMMEAFGVDAALWPEILPSGAWLAPAIRAGEVAVVASCSHDTACAVAAAPAVRGYESWAYISCGTWSLMGDERQAPLLSKDVREAGFTNEAGVDGTIRFLKNLTGLWVLQECVREWRTAGSFSWSDLEQEANAVVPSKGNASSQAHVGSDGTSPAYINLEDARFLARGDMEHRLHAYCREHGMQPLRSRGEIAVAILASIAESYRRTLAELERLTGKKYRRIHLFGGGSRNALLCQMTANACQMDVVAGPTEATAMGNLLIQARAMGDLPDGQRIRDIASVSSHLTVYSPERD